MTVAATYSLEFVQTIDPQFISANADATSLSTGGVFVVGDDISHIDGSFFDGAGTFSTGPLSVAGLEGATAELSNGNLVIASDNGDRASFIVVDTAGATVVASTTVDGSVTGISAVDVAGLAGGGFVVVSEDFFAAGDSDIRVNIRNNDGTVVTDFYVAFTTPDDQNPSVAALADGGFVVAWHRNIMGESELWYAVYEANGTVRKAAAMYDTTGTINQNASAVALANGGFAIAYEDNGWNGDVDISLARFDSAGNPVDVDDVSQNAINDSAPSTTILSNGMIAIGSTSDLANDDPAWTLVDQTSGSVLATSSSGATGADDSSTTLAAMAGGKIAVFFTASGDVAGRVLQAVRTSTGDGAADVIVGDSLVDHVFAGGGDDDITGAGNADVLHGEAGNDTFQVGTGDVFGDTIDGGADVDRIFANASTNLGNATILSIEEIEFAPFTGTPGLVNILAVQVGGTGFASNLLIDGNATGVPDTLRITMGTDLAVSLAAFTFQDFDTGGGENDRIIVIGDGDSETIVGSAVRDDINGNGGNDKLNGGGGADVLRGGLGNDTYFVDTAGEAIEAFNQGIDLVKSTAASYTLGNNIENLVLLGGGSNSGTGNGLANKLTGNSGLNALDGGGGKDTLTGGLGADTLSGGADRDRFDFNATAESPTGASFRDVITDFVGNGPLAGDVIDLSTIDANVTAGGNQAFTFIGSAAFSAPGQVRYSGGLLTANTDANLMTIEFEVELTGAPPLVAGDLVL